MGDKIDVLGDLRRENKEKFARFRRAAEEFLASYSESLAEAVREHIESTIQKTISDFETKRKAALDRLQEELAQIERMDIKYPQLKERAIESATTRAQTHLRFLDEFLEETIDSIRKLKP